MKNKQKGTCEMKNWKSFLMEEDGMGTVEVILIIVEKYFISYSL